MYSLLITFFLLALLVSFLCSLWEAVLLSVTPSYAQIKLREGTFVGKKLESFKRNIDRPLAAILTLNTIAHTVGAIGVGEQASQLWLATHPMIAHIVVPVVVTLAILVFSEIIPKTIGANYWKELAPFTAHSLSFIILMLYPLVWFSQLLTRLLKKDKSISVFTRSDFVAMTEIGEQQGVFARNESAFIRNLLHFDSILARNIMTPRPVVVSMPEDMTAQQLYEKHRPLRFSRIPIYRGHETEDVTGYVLKDEMLERLVAGQGDIPLAEIRRDMLTVHEGLPIPALFDKLLNQREQIALVVDEFGGMCGIVTIEDVIETLLGLEIVDELDSEDDMQKLARRQWEQRARRLGLLDE